MKKLISTVILPALLLTACSSGVEKTVLEGERISVNVRKSALQENPAALQTALRLPRTSVVESWSQNGGNSSHDYSNIALPQNVTMSWKASLGGGNTKSKRLLSTPVVENGAVFAANTKGEVFAISLEYGEELWEVELTTSNEKDLLNAPVLAVKNNAVFVALSNGEIVAINALNGLEMWRTALDLPVSSAPAVAGDHVYIITQNNSFFALNVQTGKLEWTHNGIEEQLAILGGPSAAIASEGVVMVPYSSGEIYALSQKDGRYLWYDALSVNVGADLYSSLVDVEASPVIADGVVYAVNHNGQLTAFDLKNGRRFWSVALSATQMPWVAGSVVYVVTENDELVCINRRDGLIRWVKDLTLYLDEDHQDENAYFAGPVLAGDRLFITSSVGEVLTVDPFDGEKVSSFDVGEAMSLPPIVSNERLIVLTDKARIYTFK